MTPTQFCQRRRFGQIAPDVRVRTILFQFHGRGTEWAEVFVDERYETIEQQEQRFRAAMCFATIRTPLDSGTVAAKDWVTM
jgi:hypothetical protein